MFNPQNTPMTMIARVLLPLSFALSVYSGLKAQVPNGGFENWVDRGAYQEPVDWTSWDFLITSGPYTCERGTPGAVGTAYARITTRDVPGATFGDIFTRFPFASRPAALNGQVRHDIANGDIGAVNVFLRKWNPVTQMRELVGEGRLTFVGREANWRNFSVRIDYISGGVPDTAYIELLSSEWTIGIPTAGSQLDIDDLSFGAFQSIEDHQAMDVLLFPVPASDRVQVTAGGPMAELRLWSTDGRMVAEQRPAGARAEMDVRELSPGVYLLEVRMADGTLMRRNIVRE